MISVTNFGNNLVAFAIKKFGTDFARDDCSPYEILLGQRETHLVQQIFDLKMQFEYFKHIFLELDLLSFLVFNNISTQIKPTKYSINCVKINFTTQISLADLLVYLH